MTVTKSEAHKAMRRIVESLKELDLLEVSALAEMHKCEATIDRFKGSKVERVFKRAQEAAIRADFCHDELIRIAERRKAILKALKRVTALYTGDDDVAEALLRLITAGGNPEKVRDKTALEEATAIWKDICRISRIMAMERSLKENKL